MEMYESPAEATAFTDAYLARTGYHEILDRDFFEAAMGFRRLATVAWMLGGEAHAADNLATHLPLMSVPLEWVRESTGHTIPEVEDWIAG